jgi:hypothetical protein
MHGKRSFDSQREYAELQRMLAEAISRGYVEQVPVMKPSRLSPLETWYRDRKTGEIYRLYPPDPDSPDRGWWDRVDIEELKEPGPYIQ